MKAIIIQDHDARALLDQLKLETMDVRTKDYAYVEMDVRKVLEAKCSGIDKKQMVDVAGAIASLLMNPKGEIATQVHGRFHYVVVRWLQEQGASVVR